MAIILEKEVWQDVSILKLNTGLSWEPNEESSEYPFDPDVSVFY